MTNYVYYWDRNMTECRKDYTRGTQREYSSKPLKHSLVERILVFERQI